MLREKCKGITLVALVITIVILLILAGITISTLTNTGIFQKAKDAKVASENAEKEQKQTLSEYEKELNKYTAQELTDDKINKVLSETENIVLKDANGNIFTLPAGFKVVVNDDTGNAKTVGKGIVIEDATDAATKGSQFVWIPVGDVKTADEGTVNIELNRYTFDENGTPIAQNQNIIDNRYTEINVSTYGNTTAKENIEDESSGFRKKVKESHGYYIGRYEARDKEATTSRYFGPVDNQIVCTPNNYVYNFVKQPQAANLARNMYNSNLLASDLVNSYAWDTAILFLQTFDNRLDKTKPYSKQNSLNTGVDPIYKGTNILKSDENQDKICNVFDMAGNCLEWSTETSTYENNPAILRGGYCLDSQGYTDTRWGNQLIDGNVHRSFRPILYL